MEQGLKFNVTLNFIGDSLNFLFRDKLSKVSMWEIYFDKTPAISNQVANPSLNSDQVNIH